jgi:hypothetical protein
MLNLKNKKIIWVYERNGKYLYRRPFGKMYPRELIILNKPINNN